MGCNAGIQRLWPRSVGGQGTSLRLPLRGVQTLAGAAPSSAAGCTTLGSEAAQALNRVRGLCMFCHSMIHVCDPIMGQTCTPSVVVCHYWPETQPEL